MNEMNELKNWFEYSLRYHNGKRLHKFDYLFMDLFINFQSNFPIYIFISQLITDYQNALLPFQRQPWSSMQMIFFMNRDKFKVESIHHWRLYKKHLFKKKKRKKNIFTHFSVHWRLHHNLYAVWKCFRDVNGRCF